MRIAAILSGFAFLVAACSLVVNSDDLTTANIVDSGQPSDGGIAVDSHLETDSHAPLDDSGPETAAPFCVQGQHDFCFDFTDPDLLAGGWKIFTSGTTYDPAHFARDTSVFRSGPSALKYSNVQTKYAYEDAFYLDVGKNGKHFDLAFDFKVSSLGAAGSTTSLGVIVFSYPGTNGDFYLYFNKGSVQLQSRYYDTAYKAGPSSANIQILNLTDWHRYELAIDVNPDGTSVASLSFDGNAQSDAGVVARVPFGTQFKSGPPRVIMGLFDLNDSAGPTADRIFYFDNVTIDVKP